MPAHVHMKVTVIYLVVREDTESIAQYLVAMESADTESMK